ncbi:MAG TPA: pyrimidine dimer DNA glycosylase/endonuclease V [bacterium]|nr:pyrimidine dimer DNA glycosylase/endonuclease V [bacterium]
MRLWSFDPKYLDSIGLIALWRESLLAKKVLQHKTKGYRNHPQLLRFKTSDDTLKNINFYLYQIFNEAQTRGYHFDKRKINLKDNNYLKKKIEISNGQIRYEFDHFLKKIKIRDYQRYLDLKDISKIEGNKVFKIVKGNIANWEKIK